MKLNLQLVLTLSLLASNAAFADGDLVSIQAVESDLKTCSHQHSSQVGEANCIEAAGQGSEHQLNVVYERGLKALSGNPELTLLYRSGERSWLNYRDAYCGGYVAKSFEGGNGQSLGTGSCYVQLTISRVKDLLRTN